MIKKQLSAKSTPIALEKTIIQPEFIPVQPKKKAFHILLKEKIETFPEIKRNTAFLQSLSLEKFITISKIWTLYKILKEKAHQVVQEGFQMYQKCKKSSHFVLEGVVSELKAQDDKDKPAGKLKLKKKNRTEDSPQESEKELKFDALKSAQVEDEKILKKEENLDPSQVYDTLIFGLQLRELCDWIFLELSLTNPQGKNQEDFDKSVLNHKYFYQTVPDFAEKANKNIHFDELNKKDKELVKKISLGYSPQKTQKSIAVS